MNRPLKVLFFVLGITIILVLLIYFVRIPYYIHSRGLTMAPNEWILKKERKGTLVSIFKNNLLNSTTEFTVTEFQRGDLAEFHLKDNIFSLGKVTKGDTIGIISSTEEETRYIELLAELQVQQSLLKVYTSGEKPERVKMAYEEMLRAEQEYNTQKLLTERQEKLFKDGYVPSELYEISYNDLIVKKQNENVAKANYESLITGAKQEEVDYINASIHALELQIEQAKKRMASFYITSPLHGTIVDKRDFYEEEDIILSVADQSDLLVIMPIPVFKVQYLEKEQNLIFKSSSFGVEYQARIVSIDNSAQMVGQYQNVFVTAVLTEKYEDLLPGMILDATINTGWVDFPEYIKRVFSVVFEN